MSVREKLNENPKMTAIGVGAIALISLIWILSYSFWPEEEVARQPSGIYYSQDDGKTYVVGPHKDLATGSARAILLQYPGEEPYIAWLEKYTPRGQQLLAEYYSKPENEKRLPPETLECESERMVKRPGGGTWVNVIRQKPLADKVREFELKNGNAPSFVVPPAG